MTLLSWNCKRSESFSKESQGAKWKNETKIKYKIGQWQAQQPAVEWIIKISQW